MALCILGLQWRKWPPDMEGSSLGVGQGAKQHFTIKDQHVNKTLHRAQDRNQWQTLVNTLMNLQVS